MNFIEWVIRKPVTVVVGVIFIVLFGWLSASRLPIQLAPDVALPEITVTTIWPGASPYEIEREIIEEQEEVLKGLKGLVKMESESTSDLGRIILTFDIDSDLKDILLRTSNKLNEVPSYPENVEKPVITASGANASPVIWTIFKTRPGNSRDINTYLTYFDDSIRQHLERVDGVAELYVVGGTEDEMQVMVDPQRLVIHGLTMGKMVERLVAENTNLSAGDVSTRKRKYLVRTVGEYKSPKDIGEVVITEDRDRLVRVADVADVAYGHKKVSAAIRHDGQSAIAVGIKKEVGANVLTLTRLAKVEVERLNREILEPQGLYLDWVYDQTPYINSAIGLVKQNMMVGGLLAIVVLFLFLRSFASTLIIALAIPVSVVGTFIFLVVGHRNLNVISLAGMAFAVGMVVDNAIVVLENIDRHRKMGKPPFAAALEGTTEVWGAVLASTVTTLAVFLPVVFIREEAGQLFKDLAIAICGSVALSLLVSVTVIPMLANQLFSHRHRSLDSTGDLFSRFGALFSGLITVLVGWINRNWVSRIVVVVMIVAASLGVSRLLLPKMEYLPQGNRNLILSILVPPPGYSDAERQAIGEYIGEQLRPYQEAAIDGADRIDTYFYVGRGQMLFLGAKAEHPEKVKTIIPVLQKIISGVPGMFGVTVQRGLFESGLGKGRTIEVDLRGGDLQQLVTIGGTMFGMISQAIPGAQIRPVPSLELTNPEVLVIPDRRRCAALGIDARELAITVDVLLDGRKIDDFKPEGRNQIDLTLMSKTGMIQAPEQVAGVSVLTPGGRQVPISSLASIRETAGPTQINHLERKRAVTLQVTPPEAVPLEKAMDIIADTIIPQVKKMGLITGDEEVSLSGTADKLTQTRKALQGNFLLALAITYLLMAALFENFFYPLIIMVSVPMAAAGGFIGLALVNRFLVSQPMDVLTMLGFIILVGVVVNNAILIVHQALNFVRTGELGPDEAIVESVRTRIRPIFMSTLTSLLGMLPLVLFPGAGSELYRGLGSVVLGGLALSTVFTLLLIPALLGFFLRPAK
ncbi:MAG: efflux RND transporter permease subunit [Deltaproteobacteria bacterium]|nr:efflux RND transporter permease subunit [Candidatus Anaeroferrophillus wilburensis]MBN2888760.1 efflux RND transporter permease subunit [Deltaproteobacteria bacterium]